MTLHILLNPETEARLRQRAAEAGKDPATYAREALEEQLAFSPDSASAQPPLPTNQRVAEFHDWVSRHRPVGHFIDDRRETIYEGRGE